MVARIYEETDLAPDESAPWPEQMMALLGWMVDALRVHPSTAILLATRNVASEGSLRTTEAAGHPEATRGSRRRRRRGWPATR
jgi:TetR/AcrR family tetracycline transcriptional repressor